MQTLDEIYLGAREIADASARAAYLNEACGADVELRRRVEAMLADAGGADDFFGSADNSHAASHRVIEQLGAVIGRYKLLQKIGEGGMGVVYMAEQREPVVRKVALKIIKAGMDTRQVIARFEAERQALALMEHPNIARVLDGGETETGRPYFVMDLVQGLSITQFCDEGKLPTRQRLDLFLEVCEAVQHAHQKGIIHRDLKPSNILVTLHGDKPVPKVIDFGIAKATQQRLTDKTLFTQFHHFMGTPAYMSPEQASLSGLDVDTRSDIYALGVLLYELLTSTTPFDGKELLQSGFDEMRRIIAEKEPLRPSTRLSQLEREQLSTTASCRHAEARALIHLLQGDLDWIVMKCLEKDRVRRYDTVNGLAGDVRRFLADEPVTACPPSALYRFQKLVRRNKLQFAGAAIIGIILVAASVVSSWQAWRATRAQRIATEQGETARTVKDFLVQQLLGRADPWIVPVYDGNNRFLLERVARAVEGGFTNQPLVEAEVRYALAEAFFAMNETSRATAEYEKAYDIWKQRLGATHSDTLKAVAGIVTGYWNLGRDREAEQLLDNSISLAQRSSQRVSQGAAELLFTRGRRLVEKGRNAEAMPCLLQARDMLRQTVGDDDLKVTQATFYVALATYWQGQWRRAELLFEEGLRRSERLHGTNHPFTAMFLKAQGFLLMHESRLDEAAPKLERAISILRQTLGPDQALTLESEGFLAQALELQGHIDEAAERYAELGRRWAKHLPKEEARVHVSFGPMQPWRKYRVVAEFFVRHRRFPEARAVFADLKKAFTLVPPQDLDQFETFLAAAAAVDGWPAAAELCRRYFDDFSDSLSAWLTKAWIFRHTGDEERYRQVVERVLGLAPTARDVDDQRLILEIAALGPNRFSDGQVDRLDSLMKALQAAKTGPATDQQRRSHRAIAHLQLQLGRHQSCLDALEKAASNQTTPDAYALFIKALCLHRLNRSDEAREASKQAEAIVQRMLPEPLSESERFLPAWQVYRQFVLRREVQAALDGIGPKP